MENKRSCNTCKEIKPFTEFFFDKRFNIPFARCKLCFNAQCKRYRDKNKIVYRKWVTSEKGKLVRFNAMKKWRTNNSHKRKAHNAISNALRDGKIIKLPCQKCGHMITEAHHASYEKEHWLNVIWLCKIHHTQETYSLR